MSELIHWRLLPVLFAFVLSGLFPFSTRADAQTFLRHPVAEIDHGFPFAAPVISADDNLSGIYGDGLNSSVFIRQNLHSGQIKMRIPFEGGLSMSSRFVNDGAEILVAESDLLRRITISKNGTFNEKIASTLMGNSFFKTLNSPSGRYVVFSELMSGLMVVLADEKPVRYDSNSLKLDTGESSGWSAPPEPIAVSDEGVVYLSHDNSVYSYDLVNKTGGWSLRETPEGYVSQALLSADGQRLLLNFIQVGGNSDGTSLLINALNGQVLAQIPISDFIAADLSFYGDKVLLLEKEQARVWSPFESPAEQSLEISGTARYGTISAAGELVAIVKERNRRYQTLLFSTNADGWVSEAPDEFIEQSLVVQAGSAGRVMAHAVSADGELLATADIEGTIWLWALENGRAIRKLDLTQQLNQTAYIESMTFNPIRHELLILTHSGSFVWALNDMPATMINSAGWAAWGNDVLINADGNRYVSLSYDVGSDFFTHNTLDGSEEPVAVEIEDSRTLSAPMVLAPDGLKAACTTEHGDIALINAETGQVDMTIQGLGGEVKAIAFDPRSRLLVAATETDVLIYDLVNRSVLGTIPTDLQSIRAVAVQPQGSLVVAAGADDRIVTIDLSTDPPSVAGYINWRAPGSIAEISGMSFARGGQQLVITHDFDNAFADVLDFSKNNLISLTAFTTAVDSARFSPDHTRLIVKRADGFTVWNLEKGGVEKRIPSFMPNFSQIYRNASGVMYAEADQTRQTFKFWHPTRGESEMFTLNTFVTDPQSGEFIYNPTNRYGFSPKGKMLHLFGDKEQIIYDRDQQRTCLKANEELTSSSFDAFRFSADESIFVMANVGRQIVAYDLNQSTELWRTRVPFAVSNIYFSGDEKTLVVTGNTDEIRLLDTTKGELLSSMQFLTQMKAQSFIPVFKGVAVNYILGAAWNNQTGIFDLNHQDSIGQVNLGEMPAAAVEENSGRLVILGSSGKLTSLDPADPEDQRSLDLATPARDLTLSDDGTLLAVVLANGSIQVLEHEKFKQVARLLDFIDGHWAVVAVDGRYDASDPGDLPGLSWVLADEPFTPRPVEIFMREYYEPRLLPRLIAHENFPEIRQLETLNREQPLVKIVEVKPAEDGRTATVEIEIATKRPDTGQSQQTEVHDLKVFRNDQLVAYFPDENGRIEIDQKSGKRRLLFDDILLPTSTGEQGLTFSTYAFNEDGIKSETARKRLDVASSSGSGHRRAIIIGLGMNAYENPSWNLRYAANDARAMIDVLQSRLQETGAFSEVITIPLISDTHADQPQAPSAELPKVTSAVIEVVFAQLAGKEVSTSLDAKLPAVFPDLPTATPDDLLLITYSGHGIVDQAGQFHLFPYDIGRGDTRRVDAELFEKTVSSVELSNWLRDVDAGESIMIIDACNSAASVEGEGFKPGPMGSRGLGQLAYDKGMRILAASQAEAVAFESDQLDHGMLTYSLINEGLEEWLADFSPQDDRISVDEWLNYGLKRVPDLYSEIRDDRFVSQGRGAPVFWGKKKERETLKVQQPGLFDFHKLLDGFYLSVKP